MKNIPQPEELKASTDGGSSDAADAPVMMPGTEGSRTLGDMMREAEANKQAAADVAAAIQQSWDAAK